MQKNTVVRVLSVFILAISFSATAASVKDEGDSPRDTKTEIKEYIAHHLLDSHDFNIMASTDEATG